MKSDELRPGYETVFTITDYYDGPRKGIANYQGNPDLFESIFDEAKDGYSDVFRLTPPDKVSFQLAMEDWEIRRGWEIAFHDIKTDIISHPALPHEAGRHAELKRILDNVLVTDLPRAISRIGVFEVLGTSGLPNGGIRPLQVKWIQPVY